MNKVLWTPGLTTITCSENLNKGIVVKGVMMPEGEISRNGVMYDWESVTNRHKDLVDKPVMYNHVIDGEKAVSLGHYTDSKIMTVNEIMADDTYKVLTKKIEKLGYKGDKKLWVYEADLDPNEEKYINKIRRGDLQHVSIQLKPSSTEERVTGDDVGYTYAYVEDLIEGSVVSTPGFLQTCAVMAEMFSENKLFLNNTNNLNKNIIALSGQIKEVINMTKKEQTDIPNKDDEKVTKVIAEPTESDEKKEKKEIIDEEDKKKEVVDDEEDKKKEVVDDEEDKKKPDVVDEEPMSEEDEDKKVKKESDSEDDEKITTMEKMVTILETMDGRLSKLESVEDETVPAEVETQTDAPIAEGISLKTAILVEKKDTTELKEAIKGVF